LADQSLAEGLWFEPAVVRVRSLFGVQRDQRSREDVVTIEGLAGCRKLERRGMRRSDQAIEGEVRVSPAEAKARLGVPGAGLEETIQRALEARRLCAQTLRGPVDVLIGIEGPVEHQRPVIVWEERGVRRAEERAVGKAEIGELLVAQRFAQGVHVARDVARRYVVKRSLAVLLQARVDQIFGPAGPCGFVEIDGPTEGRCV
jgi:hypothetical protein